MATQSESHNDDLDKTDELPRLDVATYEASLAKAAGEGLSGTDTWAVEALQDLDEIAQSERQSATPPPPPAPECKVAGASSDPPINVARIMQRMAQLEADIAEAHDANAALQKRNQAIQEAREEQIVRIRALEADNERLSEHHTLATGMQERFEQQLREQSLQVDAQLKEIQSARFAERLRADQEREEFRHQAADMGAQIAALQQDNRRLHEQSQASLALANRHQATLSALEASLGDQKAGAAQLARQLAAKLTDYETLSSMVEARNRNINELVRARDDLQQRLDRETAAGAELGTRLENVEMQLRENRSTLLARDASIAEKDTQLVQLRGDLQQVSHELEQLRRQNEATALNLSRLDTAQSESSNALAQRLEEISALRNSLQAAEDATAKAQRELAVAAVTATGQEKLRQELEARLDESQQRIDALTDERISAFEQVRALGEERDRLLPLSAQLIARSQELERSDAEVARLQAELTALRAEMASQSEAAQARAQLLNERTEELAGLHTRFSEHGFAVRGLEHAIRARDELLDKLRAQLQTAQDERSIMADQLDKARTRAKSMAQQIFQRDNQIASLRADLAARAQALAAIRRDVDRIEADAGADADASGHFGQVLEPVGHDGYPIFLNAKLITVGRTSENDVCIPSKLISRHHARLMVAADGAVTVEDAGSTNGCYVNGQQVHSHALQEGDVLELGDLRYRMYSRPQNGTRIRTNVVSISDGRRGPD